MNRPRIFLFVIVFMGCVMMAFAAKKEDIPPWMENIDASGRSTYLVPRGARRKVVGSQVLVEAPNEYVARRMYEIEEYLEGRFRKIERDQKEIKEELRAIKEMIDGLDKDAHIKIDLTNLTNTVEGLEKQIEEILAVKESAKLDEKADELIGIVEEAEEPKDIEGELGREDVAEKEGI